MTSLNILYLGPISGTCLDRANALRRMGHRVSHLDPRKLLPATVWIDRIMWRAGGHLFAPLVATAMSKLLGNKQFDLCHVDNGEWVSPSVVRVLRQHCLRVINYNIDDPTGPRDRMRFAAYRRAVPHYDLLAVVRQDNIPEIEALGARHAMRVYRSADEVEHAPQSLTNEDHARWDCDVLFLGTWMPERGPFLVELIKRGVPLTIRGGNWHKAPEWTALKAHHKGGPVYGADYAKAIQCARVNIGMLSKGNRDLHTTRSLEIPSLGGLFCAERTVEHLGMYQDGTEAIFWSTAEECAKQCMTLLQDEERRRAIAEKGRARYLRDGNHNERIMASMLSACAAV
jgi:spore maturation protein CgeB